MTEILTESFCERCGTRYTFETVQQRGRPLKRVGTLGRGLRHFLVDPDSSIGEALAVARSEDEQRTTTAQLEAFHRTFNFCLQCRQYTCAECWNAVEGRCLTCAPLPIEAVVVPAVSDGPVSGSAMAQTIGYPLPAVPDAVELSTDDDDDALVEASATDLDVDSVDLAAELPTLEADDLELRLAGLTDRDAETGSPTTMEVETAKTEPELVAHPEDESSADTALEVTAPPQNESAADAAREVIAPPVDLAAHDAEPDASVEAAVPAALGPELAVMPEANVEPQLGDAAAEPVAGAEPLVEQEVIPDIEGPSGATGESGTSATPFPGFQPGRSLDDEIAAYELRVAALADLPPERPVVPVSIPRRPSVDDIAARRGAAVAADEPSNGQGAPVGQAAASQPVAAAQAAPIAHAAAPSEAVAPEEAPTPIQAAPIALGETLATGVEAVPPAPFLQPGHAAAVASSMEAGAPTPISHAPGTAGSCRNCGLSISASARFCRRCGTRQDAA